MDFIKYRASVASWRDKFRRSYPGFECDVLLGDGSVAYGNVLLETINGRQTIIRNISTHDAVIYVSSDKKSLDCIRDIELMKII